ncbi:elongin A, like [Thalassophryne amazonica]|uniref:elongin A, like n=1 Tax=Thalassophryne amazonica TaxID=390379 RepID=UPI0014713497|nr:elongin A, like [Thalassophryne amazonica]
MARSSDVVKKIRSFERQLSDTTQPATILKTLRKLEQLDVTLDILAETGIGKTVNSLRRHEQVGDFAKSLVRSWKKMIPKESVSNREKDGLGNMPFKDQKNYRNCPNNRLLTTDESKSTCLASPGKNQDASDELFVKKGNRKTVSEKPQCKEKKRHEDQNGNCQNPKHSNMESETANTKMQLQEDKHDASLSQKDKDHSKGKSKDPDGEHKSKKYKDKSRHSFQEKLKSSSDIGSDKELHKKKLPKEVKEHVLVNSSDKWSKMQNMVDEKEDRSSGLCHRPEVQNCNKRKKLGKGRDSGLEYSHDSEDESNSTNEHKKAKMKQKDEQSESEPEEPSMSFESYLNYDFNTTKTKKPSRAKYLHKKIKTVVKQEKTKALCVKPAKLPVLSTSVGSPKKKPTEFPDLVKTSTSAVLPDSDKISSVGYSQRKVENSDVCNLSEEPAVFTGQRLNSKMQVYSGAKTTFLATMMSLYQQCIRTLQNNVNLLYETGGVPFEILEPVLERCTPEQLLRIEDCNPIYIGVTDHLWGKHCERDFRDAKLEEYESWKEMYIRLSDEREMKLRRLTKSIVSAHSNKPKGRQVKMAFIHTAAKPPRDVRIQQEIHGTAVQQPPQLKCSGKVQDNRSKHSHSDPSRSNVSSSGMNNVQDARKKTRVAPMMAKSLKALKQLGRR